MMIKDMIATHYKMFCATVFIIGSITGVSTQIVFAQQFGEHEATMNRAVNILDARFKKEEVERSIETYTRIYEVYGLPSDKRKLDSLQRELTILEEKINS